jgi:transmembrane sensor
VRQKSTTSLSMEKSSQTEEQAARWLLQIEAPDWSDADQQALAAWLASSTANTVAFLRLEAAWQEMRRLKAFSAGTKRGSVPSPDDWQFSPFFDDREMRAEPVTDWAPLSGRDSGSHAPRDTDVARIRGRHVLGGRARRLRSLAASLLVAALAAGTWYFWPAGPTYQTPVGGTASVPMSDGSNVTLNTNTRIEVALGERERAVQLERGEAFFEVAKDPRRPFVVSAGRKRVVAVGTKFSVEREGDEVRVVVSEGTVRIEDAAASRPHTSTRSANAGANTPVTDRTGTTLPPEADSDASNRASLAGEGVMLSAGGVARAQGDSVLVQEKPVPEVIEEYLSWRSGYLVFHDVPLAEAVAESNRYNVRQIEIDDSAVAAIKVSGKFRSTNFEAFVRLLEDGLAIHAHSTDDQIILSKR